MRISKINIDDQIHQTEYLPLKNKKTSVARKVGQGAKKMGGRYEEGIGPLIVYMGPKTDSS